MHLYKNFLKMVGKQKSGIITYAIIFILMVFGMVGAAYSGNGGTAFGTSSVELSSYTIGYVDNSGSEASHGLIEYLGTNNTLIDLKDKSTDSVNTMVFFSTIECNLEINKDFASMISGDDYETLESQGAISFLTYANGGSSEYLITDAIDKYCHTYHAYKLMGLDDAEAVTKTAETLGKTTEVSTYIPEASADSDKSSEGLPKDNVCGTLIPFYAYLSLGALCLCVGSIIIKMNNRKVSSRINVSPVNARKLTLSNMLGLITCGGIVCAVFSIFILSFGKGGKMVDTYAPQLVLMLVLITICNCAITVFVSSFNLSANVLPMVTNILSLSMSFMSGIFVPLYLLGDEVTQVAQFLPFYWYSRTVNTMYERSYIDLEYSGKVLAQGCGMLIIFSVALVIGAIIVRKYVKIDSDN